MARLSYQKEKIQVQVIRFCRTDGKKSEWIIKIPQLSMHGRQAFVEKASIMKEARDISKSLKKYGYQPFTKTFDRCPRGRQRDGGLAGRRQSRRR